MKISQALRAFLVKSHGLKVDATDDEAKTLLQTLVADGKMTAKEVGDLQNQAAIPERLKGGPSIDDILNAAAGSENGNGGTVNIRVKAASERYRKERRSTVHKHYNVPVNICGAPAEEQSELDFAKMGVFAKHRLASQAKMLVDWGLSVPHLTEHEKGLLAEIYHEDDFCGHTADGKVVHRSSMSDLKMNVKMLLDDSTSGGQNLVPYEFDSGIVTYPYLHSQILPLVDTRTTNSSEVQSATLDTVTVSWGTNEGTEVPIFDTDGMINNLTIPIKPVTAAIDWGKDFELDTPISDFGRIIQEQFGQALLKEMDRVVCLGNGTSEPEGFLVAGGTVGVNSDGGTGAAPTLNDYIKLHFSLPLEYREQPSLNACYVSNDTTFKRSRQIKIDANTPSTDQRPVFGMNIRDYNSFGYAHKINNSIANTKLAFLCLKKYRLYRRFGVDFMLTDQGYTLARRNLKLLVVRQRWGGIMADPNACAIMADTQS